MTCLLPRILPLLATLLVAAHAQACEAGWMQMQVAGTTPDAPTTTVALYCPTDTPGMPIPSPDGDIAANPRGFDRAAFLKRLADEITVFFDMALR